MVGWASDRPERREASEALFLRLADFAQLPRRRERGIIVALLGRISQHYWPQWMALALPMFGVARFSVRMCDAAITPLATGRKARLAALGAVLVTAGVLSVDEIPQLSAEWEVSASLAACAAAIISADYLVRRWRTQHIKRVDWLVLLSFLAGWMAVPPSSFPPSSNYAYDLTMSILRPYAVSFVSCLLARVVVNNLPPRLRFM